jgi:hypothetical protein
MTDYLGRFGAVTNTGSANILDFESIDPRAAMQNHRTGEQHEATVVFHTIANITGSVTPKLQDCSDISASSPVWTDLLVGQAVANPKAGAFAFIPMPKMHKRYLRAALAAAQAGVTAYLEPGPYKPEK